MGEMEKWNFLYSKETSGTEDTKVIGNMAYTNKPKMPPGASDVWVSTAADGRVWVLGPTLAGVSVDVRGP